MLEIDGYYFQLENLNSKQTIKGRGRIGPQIGPNRTFLLRTMIVIYSLKELNKLSIFRRGTWSTKHFLREF